MRTKFLTTAVLLLTASFAHAQQATGVLSADDFLNPAQGGSTEIAAPDEITVEKDVVTAVTMQDAANKAAEITVQAARNQNFDAPPFKLITSQGGGIGAIATGRASYFSDATNRDAQRIAMRQAYIRAFTEAKRNLAQGFNGLSSEGATIIGERLQTIIDNNESLKSRESDMYEGIVQRVEGLIRAYEVWQIEDFPEDSMIAVTISVNGNALGSRSRSSAAVIESVDLRTGLNHVFDEIQRGIAFPAGGRVIIADNGEVSFVGYGSALILEDNDPRMRAELINNARRIAEARARDSLTGMIVGDEIIWETGIAERHADDLRDFVDVEGWDMLPYQLPGGIMRLNERKSTVMTLTEVRELTTSVRRGVLPPGVIQRTFRDNDNVWYYAVAVYNPRVSQDAANLGEQMRNATIIQPIRSGQGRSGGVGTTPARTDVTRPSTEIQMIPTGRVGE